MSDDQRRRKFWGWGYEDQTLTRHDAAVVAERVGRLTGVAVRDYTAPPDIDEIRLAAPRVAPPVSLRPICSDSHYHRAAHTYGKSYPDYVRAFARTFDTAPDVVAFPTNEDELASLLDWAGDNRVAAIPYGGGSSVVGGVEPRVSDAYAGTLSIDLQHLSRVLEIDPVARSARIQGGALGPRLEAALKPAGLTLRHFPQSFEFSTLGGWIATRSGGHFATLFTHIDELVQSLRVITPRGVIESRRLPGSGAGPSPDRLLIGSEGSLGVITEAWMRLQDRPTFRASAAVRYAEFASAAAAVRAISQAGLWPTNCRLIDAEETRLAGAGDGSYHLVVIAFESADHPVEAWMSRALECARDHGGAWDDDTGGRERDPVADAWREAFISAPYNREALIAHGIMHDTFETAITWERLESLHTAVKAATETAIHEATGAPGHVTCRFTHTYPDGPAPYFTYHARTAPGGELEQWKAIKTAASHALIAAGGTITHHHAVGRDHMPWYRANALSSSQAPSRKPSATSILRAS